MSSINIGKVFGININLHYSWFFILIILAWSLAIDFFPQNYPGFSTSINWILGLASGILLFVSVLAHELSHSLVARKHGIEVKDITLFFFGGMANASEENMEPGMEFQIAIAGPILSVLLGGLFFLILLINPGIYISAMLEYLYKINLILAAFNMIPGFPLDGGRVLRSILWKYTGSLRKSTKYASTTGKIFAGLMIVWGLMNVFSGQGGLWFILLGGFLYLLAQASYEQVLLKEDLNRFKVKDILIKDFEKVESSENLENFVDKIVKDRPKGFIVQEKGNFYVMNFDKLKQIPRHSWPVSLVRDIMVKVNPTRESHNAFDALLRMQDQDANMLPVVKNKKVVGVVTLDSLIGLARSGILGRRIG